MEKDHPGVTALFFQGCGADQNPLPRRSIALARQYGEELASAVTRVIHMPGDSLHAELKTAYAEIELALTAPPTREQLEKYLERDVEFQKRWARRLLDQMDQGKPFQSSYNYPVQL